MDQSSFKLSRSLENRIGYATRMKKKYPDKITVIAEASNHSQVPNLENNKLLVPVTFTIDGFKNSLRQKIKLGPENDIFLFVKNTLPPTAALMSAIYEEHKDEDGFLYMTYSGHDIITELSFRTKISLDIFDSMTTELGGTACISVAPQTWSYYLSLIELLVAISKTDHTLMEQTLAILRTSSFSSMVTLLAKREDQNWVLSLDGCINFEVRQHFAEMMFIWEDGLDNIIIDRSKLLTDSFQQIMAKSPFLLHGELSIRFYNEKGLGQGVDREWFCLVCEALFKPENKLFVASTDDCRRFAPSASVAKMGRLEYFRFAGRILALMIKNQLPAGVLLDNIFYLQLAKKAVTLEDVRCTDVTEYNSCLKVLEMSKEMLEVSALTFSIDVDKKLEIPLVPNGQNVLVTFEDKERYIELRIQMKYVTLVEKQVLHFAQGFEDLLDGPYSAFFNTLSLEDLDCLLRGIDQEDISIQEWKLHTEYQGFEEKDDVIGWFWEIVKGMDQTRRRRFLYFWTAVRFLPMNGFEDLPTLTIVRGFLGEMDKDKFPVSSTCAFQLQIQNYEDFEKMEKHLMYVSESDNIIGFGNV